MTESVQPGRVILAPNGVTTTFALPFRALTDPVTNKTNLVVKPVTIATGVIGAALVEGTDYTVSNVGSTTCSIVTEGASSPWAATSYLVAYTSTAVEQETSYTYNGPFPSADAEAALDWLTQIARNHEDRLNRSLKFNIAYPVSGAINADVPTPPLNGATIYWDTTLGWTWTTVSLALLQSQAAALAAISADITTVAGISSQIVAVAGNATNVNLVGTNIANVNLVGTSIVAVGNVASDLTNINNVAADLTDINLVAGSITNVNAVAVALTAINAVYAQLTPIEGVYADLTDIVAVYGSLANINSVYADLTNINLVAADLTSIDAVHSSLTNINNVAADLTDINLVAGALTNINTVAGISANVTTVAGAAANMATIIANMATITNAANNIPKANLAASVAPGVGNDNTQGYSAGSMWVDTTHAQVYFALSVATGAASWEQAFSASTLSGLSDVSISGLASHDTLQYNSGTSKWNNVAAATALANLGGAPLASPTLTGTPLAPTATALTSNTQIATTAYVDTAVSVGISGLASKGAVAAVSTANIAGTYLTGVFTVTATGALVIDGVTCGLNSLVALVGQTATGGTGTVNGIYKVTTGGSSGVSPVLTRATNFNTSAEAAAGGYFIVDAGTVNTGTMWVNTTTGAVTLDTTALVFTEVTIGSLAASALTGTTLASNVVTSSITTVGTIAAGIWQGTTVAYGYGGTGATSFTNHGVVVAGASALATVAPGTNGNVLTSNGTDWTSAAAPAGPGGYRALSSSDTVVASDNGKTLTIAGTCALALTAAATVGNFSCYVQNTATSGIQIITITPNGSDNLDGANSTLVILPGEVRELNCNATAWVTEVIAPFVIHAVATASPTLPRTGYRGFAGNLTGSGASGGNGATDGGGGGGGGAYNVFQCMTSAKYNVNSMALTLTVGAAVTGQGSANTAGTAGNTSSVEDTTNTRFLAFAYGGGAGGGGSLGAGGGGGGIGGNTAGAPNANGTPNAGGTGNAAVTTTAGGGGVGGAGAGGAAGGTAGQIGSGGGGGNSSTILGGYSYAGYGPEGGTYPVGGGGGGCSKATTGGAGGQSTMGGGGGGGASNVTGGAGGASTNGGSGGAGSSGSGNGTAGSAPGGGGGGSVGNTSGGGAVGEINVWGIV